MRVNPVFSFTSKCVLPGGSVEIEAGMYKVVLPAGAERSIWARCPLYIWK